MSASAARRPGDEKASPQALAPYAQADAPTSTYSVEVHHGERAAALVFAYVADFYREAEDKADAEAIDQAMADSEAGERPVPFEQFAAELDL
jgi:hypothetical protein